MPGAFVVFDGETGVVAEFGKFGEFLVSGEVIGDFFQSLLPAGDTIG